MSIKKVMTEKNVLLVDDDPITIELMKAYLESEGFSVITASEGSEAIEKINSESVPLSIVVSDVNMPVMDGYQLCRSIRANNVNAQVPFVFVSGNTSLEEKLEGYAAGGNDYITKPVEPKELALKLNQIISTQLKEQNLNQRLQDSQKTAFQAMSYTSLLGQVLQFVQKSMSAHTLNDLASTIFGVTNSLGLNCVLQFRTNDEMHDFSSTGVVSPLESDVIKMTTKKGRIYDFNSRTVFNHDDFSILIKNMPIENAERYGNLKDALGNLCNVIESRTKFLLANDLTAKKDQILAKVNSIVYYVEKSLDEIQAENVSAIQKMINKLEDAMISLGLTENQEDKMRTICKECATTIDSIFEKNKNIKDQCLSILDLIGT